MSDAAAAMSVWTWEANAKAYLRAHGLAGPVAMVSISPAGLVVAPGVSTQLTVALSDAAGASTTSTSAVAWSASAGSTIDKAGNFRAQTPGAYTVTALVDGVSGSSTVTVQTGGAATAGTTATATTGSTIMVTPANPTLAPGTPQQFSATVIGPAGQPVSPTPLITWSTVPGATIDPNGNFVAQTQGTFTVTATSGGITGTTSASVQPQTMPGGGGGGGGGGGFGGGGGADSSGGGGPPPGGGAPEEGGGADGDDTPMPDQDQGSSDDDQGGGEDFGDEDNGDAVGSGFALLGVYPVDDIGDDSWLAVHTRADYTTAVTQLKASADNLNQTASNEPGWKPIYDLAQQLYDKYHDVGFFSSINPFGTQALGDSAWKAIADSQRRVDEFAQQMRSRGKNVLEPSHKPVDDSVMPTGFVSTLEKHLPLVIGGVVFAIAVPVAIPPLLALLANRNRVK